MEDGSRSFEGERHREKEERKKRHQRIERSYGRLSRIGSIS
jgi:hypothetical protein